MNIVEEQETSHILIVDDDPAVPIMAEAALESQGYEIEVATDGRAALKVIRAAVPDLVLLDVVMPGMDGFEVCRRIRALPGCAEVPILMATGLEDTESIERAYALGATDFTSKPINWTILRYRLRYLLRSSRVRVALADSEQRYALAAEGVNDGLWDWDTLTGKAYFSARWQEMLGYEDGEIPGKASEWMERVHREDLVGMHAALNAHLAAETSHFQATFRMSNREGHWRWMLCRGMGLRDQRGVVYRMSGSLSDVTEQKLAEERLLHDALHDDLTGLPNRKLFLERVAHCINIRKRREDYRFAVCFVDLDRFKNINESLGHLAGDDLLVQISRRIHKHLRSTDTLARLGGDEFAILFDDLGDLTYFYQLVERIQSRLLKPIKLGKQEVSVTASIGITLSDGGSHEAEEILRDADTAMYRAKLRGRACYEIFAPTMHAEVSESLQLEGELRRALARDEFQLAYQPILSFANEQIVGFEALLRWQHPERGLLGPGEFLEVAEECGQMVSIGHWLVREACAQMKAWQEQDLNLINAFISVNVSSREFAQTDLVETVAAALSDSGLEGKYLKLEITERVLIDNTEEALKKLDRLHTLGVRLSIDDFGTGYSSFSYLHRFPFDVLKIDRSFVKRLTDHENSVEIVRAIVVLAHNLGLSVVAEGFEKEEEKELLKSLGCEYGQGYLFSRPCDVAGVERLLSGDSLPRLPASRSA